MATRTTAEIIDRRNHAFVNHNLSAPLALVNHDCTHDYVKVG